MKAAARAQQPGHYLLNSRNKEQRFHDAQAWYKCYRAAPLEQGTCGCHGSFAHLSSMLPQLKHCLQSSAPAADGCTLCMLLEGY